MPERGGALPSGQDPYNAVGTGAAVRALVKAFPQVHGVIFDGPGEKHYELAFHHGAELLEIRRHERTLYDSLGLDVSRMERGIPRTAAFSSLTCQDYEEMGRLFDIVFPKHYFWHRGFDGLYGTVARWVQTLGAWNPSLSEADCFAVVQNLLGIQLPGVRSLLDMELGFPEEFFSQVVATETHRALAAVGDPNRTVAWVSTGRSPHAGDPMTAGDLYRILDASAGATWGPREEAPFRWANPQRPPQRALGLPAIHTASAWVASGRLPRRRRKRGSCTR